jgi:hypothetical protein
MAHSFKTYQAKPTFGLYKEPLDGGEYILNKKAKTTFCAANKCHPSVSVSTQGNLLLLNKSNYLNYYNNVITNMSNLNMNLFTTLNLSDVVVVQENLVGPPIEIITPAEIPNTSNTIQQLINYTIDPSGNLFGNTTCGANNYEYYLQNNTAPNNTIL